MKNKARTATDRHCDEQTYVITNDLGERIESLRYAGLATLGAGDPFFDEFHYQVKRTIQEALPHVNVVTFDMKKLAEDIWTEALRMQRNLKDAIVVSSCAEFATSRRGHTIEINRIVNCKGDIIGLGPRPGSVTLEKQLNSISAVANGNPVVLVEDGIFTGSTLLYLLSELRNRRVHVVAIAAGICFPKAIERLKGGFDGELVIVQEVERPYEWIPDHDFLPFVPNCGRVFGGSFGNDMLPFYTHEGLSYCFPYIYPFGDPVKWASIPKERAYRFSVFCLQEAHKLFCRLNELNNRLLTPMDLLGSVPRVSMPMSVGESKLPNTDMCISDFIQEVCTEMG